MKDTDIMPWGVHKGKEMKNVPDSYLFWLYDNVWVLAKLPNRKLN